MRGKPLVLKRLENGCIIPTSHKLNADGYFRYRLPNWVGKGRAPLVMYHRYVWEKARGAIPEGYEIDHICKNRACCNIEHLQMLEGSQHARKDNHLRYKKRKDKAKEYRLPNWVGILEQDTLLGCFLGFFSWCGVLFCL